MNRRTMNLFNYQYLGREHLKGLNEYKYNAIDTSPISIYVMQPFWNYCVEVRSKKKNGMDGKQARRTKSSSALGELFDHGVDSWACFLFPVSAFHFDVPVLNVPFAKCVEFIWPLFAICTSVPISIQHIQQSYKNGSGYNRTYYEALRPLISPAILFISSTWWGLASPHMIMHKQSRIFFSAVGATFSNIACRLVVAQMTSTRSDGFNTLLYFFVRQICDHLNIYAFNIIDRSKQPPPPAEVHIKH
ncbi:hypothetical protein I4U23_003119 [Adineta vaga]|nr:hypothetical protein I4U23_003119 [Adineta vaga]